MVIESEIDKINNDNLKKKLEKLDKNLEQFQNLISTLISLKKSKNNDKNQKPDKIKKETENINKKIEDINNTVEEINNVNSELTESLITKTELNKIILSFKTKLNNYLNQLNFTDFLLKKDELENEFLENINETKKINDNILDDLDNFNNYIKISINNFLENLINIEQTVNSSGSNGGGNTANNKHLKDIPMSTAIAIPAIAVKDNPFNELKENLNSIKTLLEEAKKKNK